MASPAHGWRGLLTAQKKETMSNFILHPQLQKDTCPLGSLPLCHVLLMNNANYPWVILVPNQPDLREFTDLNEADRATLMEEIASIMGIMETVYSPDKMNMAALGNMVPQLHIHVIARYKTDNAWPNPVWGTDGKPYSVQALREHVEILQTRLAKKIENFTKADIFKDI